MHTIACDIWGGWWFIQRIMFFEQLGMLYHYCTRIDTNPTFDKKRKEKKREVLVILHFKHTYTLCLLFKVMRAFFLGQIKELFSWGLV